MKYRLPENCAGVTHAGVPLERAADGTIEADASAAPALLSHGILPQEEPQAKIPARSRADDRRMLR